MASSNEVDYENTNMNEFDDELDDGTVQGWTKDDSSSSGSGFYTKNKRFVVGAILLSAVVMVLIFSALLVALYKEPVIPPDPRTMPPAIPLPSGAIREVFQSGPYRIEAPPSNCSNCSMWMKTINNIARPTGNIAIHEIHFSTRDPDGNLIPQSILYNHHAFIQEGSRVLAGFGAEGVESFLSVPSPYARLVRASAKWLLNVHYVSVWQFASGAPIDIVVNYTVFYTKLDNEDGTLNEEAAKKWKDVNYDLFGIALKNNAEFNVPGNGGPNSSYCQSVAYSFKSNNTLVYAQGHLHIGGINITFYDNTLNTSIVEALPAYDDCGFITRIGGGHPNYPIIAGHQYTIEACYDNSRYYTGVMGLFQCYYAPSPEIFGFLPQNSGNKAKMFYL